MTKAMMQNKLVHVYSFTQSANETNKWSKSLLDNLRNKFFPLTNHPN